MPKWITYRNDCGSSVSMDLETFGLSIDLIFCLVILSNFTPCISSATPVVTLRNENSEAYQLSFAYPRWDLQFSRDCIQNTFLLLWNCNVDCQFLKEVSFEFTKSAVVQSFHEIYTKRTHSNVEEMKITKCGVHPIFHSKKSTNRTHSQYEENLDVDYGLSTLLME